MSNDVLMLDWLSFTYHYEIDFQDYLNEGDIDLIDLFARRFPELADVIFNSIEIGGRLHYTNCMRFNDMFMIFYNYPNASMEESTAKHLFQMGLNFQVPSHALETFFSLMGIDTNNENYLKDLFEILKSRNCQVSRIDLCFDDYEKTYRPSWYAKHFFNGNYRSHFRQFQLIGNYKEVGNTFYFGSLKKRSKLLRIYDKDFESGGLIDSVRYEFELHGDDARSFFDFYIEHDNVITFGEYIQSWFCILNPDKMDLVTSTQIPLLPEWEAWLSKDRFNEEIPKKIKVPQYSRKDDNIRMQSTLYWFEHSVLPSLKGYIDLFGIEHLKTQVQQSELNERWKKYLDGLEFKDLQRTRLFGGFIPFE